MSDTLEDLLRIAREQRGGGVQAANGERGGIPVYCYSTVKTKTAPSGCKGRSCGKVPSCGSSCAKSHTIPWGKLYCTGFNDEDHSITTKHTTVGEACTVCGRVLHGCITNSRYIVYH